MIRYSFRPLRWWDQSFNGERARIEEAIEMDDLKVLLRGIMRDIDEAAPELAARYRKD